MADDAKSAPTVLRMVHRRASRPDYRICIPGMLPITVRQTTDNGHPADEVEGPRGMRIERIAIDDGKKPIVE